MKISLDFIAEALEPFGAQRIQGAEKECFFSKVQILAAPGEKLNPETVYICVPNVITKLKRSVFTNHCFVIMENVEPVLLSQLKCAVLLNPCNTVADVTNRLIDVFSQINSIEGKANELAMSGNGISDLFELFRPYFENGVLVLVDSVFNIICSSKQSVDHPYVNSILQRGYYNQDDLKEMAMRGYYDDERKYVRPIYYDASKTICGLPWLVRSFRTNGTAQGFVGFYVTSGTLSVFTMTLFTVLSNAIEKAAQVSGYSKSTLSGEEQILDDFLSGKERDNEYYRDRCCQLKLPFRGPFRIGLIRTRSDTPIKSSMVANQLRGHCPVENFGVFLYRNTIVLFLKNWSDFDVKTMSWFGDDWKDLLTILSANQAKIGLSLMIRDVSEFFIGYHQAEIALKCGMAKAPEREYFLYSDWYLDDILLNYSDVIPIEYVYVQKLDDLLLDEPKNTINSVKILYYYLTCERNISLTADKLFLHRNSVIYRIHKIKEKLAMDLDNPDIRLRLLLSMKILAILGKIPDWSSNPETEIEDVE